jgi:hypothetical protein
MDGDLALGGPYCGVGLTVGYQWRMHSGDRLYISPICEPKHGHRNPRGCLSEWVGQSDQHRDCEQHGEGVSGRPGNGEGRGGRGNPFGAVLKPPC